MDTHFIYVYKCSMSSRRPWNPTQVLLHCLKVRRSETRDPRVIQRRHEAIRLKDSQIPSGDRGEFISVESWARATNDVVGYWKAAEEAEWGPSPSQSSCY